MIYNIKTTAFTKVKAVVFAVAVVLLFTQSSAKEWGKRFGERGKTSAFEMVFLFLHFENRLFNVKTAFT
jgi:hypothetical protein